MTVKISDIAKSIEKEATEKYNSDTLIEELQSYNPDVFLEIVEFFREQNESHPHLEAYEIYLLIEESLPSELPGKKEIRKIIDDLLNNNISG